MKLLADEGYARAIFSSFASSKYMTTIEITEPKILAVEGKDEKYFFEALINRLNLSNIQILDIAGKQQFIYRLEALVKSSMQ